MFCTKCGSQLQDGVSFCPKCGAKIEQAINGANTSAAEGDTSERKAPTSEAPIGEAYAEKKTVDVEEKVKGTVVTAKEWMEKKPNKIKLLSIALGVLALIFIIGIAASGGKKDDYIDMLKQFNARTDLNYTCEEVFEEYLKSPKWTADKLEKNLYQVDVSGKAKGTNYNVKISAEVRDAGDYYLVDWVSVEINDVEWFNEANDEAAGFVLDMYDYYDSGEKNLSDYFEWLFSF